MTVNMTVSMPVTMTVRCGGVDVSGGAEADAAAVDKVHVFTVISRTVDHILGDEDRAFIGCL